MGHSEADPWSLDVGDNKGVEGWVLSYSCTEVRKHVAWASLHYVTIMPKQQSLIFSAL